MKKIIILAVFLLGVVLAPKAYASWTHREWGNWSNWSKWGECKAEFKVCGTSSGTQERSKTRTCKSEFGFGSNECSYVGQTETKTESQSCTVNYGVCEEEGQCPTECGLESSYVPDGQGGYKSCDATPACEVEEPEEPQESTPSYKPKENTFHKDRRCLDMVPEAPQWFKGEDGSVGNGWHPLLTWSAMGGDTVEFRFSEDPSDLRWRFTEPNDGHEIVGYPENSGILGPVYYYWQMRVINGCKEGPWSPVTKVFN